MYYPSRRCVPLGVLPRLGVVAWFAFVLTGCGGGDSPAPSGPAPPPPAPPNLIEGSLISVAGDGQVGSLGLPLLGSLIVKVADPSGDGLPGVTVDWSVSHTGRVSPPFTVTDSAGLAKALWILGGGTGAETATEQTATASASVSGVGSLIFTATTPSLVPLTDMGASTYFGFPGGLYPGGNVMPQQHFDAGRAFAAAVQPLDVNGNPSTDGKYVFLAIGASGVEQVWCFQTVCPGYTFTGRASADPEVDGTNLALVQGAFGGHGAASNWDSPTRPDYDRIRDTKLVPRGLSEQQVQVLWMRVGTLDGSPFPSNGNAWVSRLGNVTRALRSRYPNLRLVFLMTFWYGGYSNQDRATARVLFVEPFIYQGGFAAKWLIQAQMDQMASGVVDARTGDLNYNSVAPWIGWGPYFWADGVNPRSDGLFWSSGHLDSDGVHLSPVGIIKSADMLLTFFKTSPQARCWFVTGETC